MFESEKNKHGRKWVSKRQRSSRNDWTRTKVIGFECPWAIDQSGNEMQKRGSDLSVQLILFLTAMFASASVNNIVIEQRANECIETRLPFKTEVKLAVIAPADFHHEQSLPRILPAVLLAVKAVSSARGLLPGWNITVDHRNSQCSSTYGPLAAFEFYINRTAGHSSFNISFFFRFLDFSRYRPIR